MSRGALADALIRCLKSYGGELRDKTEVAGGHVDTKNEFPLRK